MSPNTVNAETFLADGSCLAHDGAREVHIFGALQGEEVTYREISRKKGVVIAIVDKVITSSPDRMYRFEEHYLSCSPWQILEAPAEATQKLTYLTNLFSGLVPESVTPTFLASPQLYNYRTKMEYSFADRDAPLSLAFHERGGSSHRLRLLQGCALGSVGTNAVALAIADTLRNQDMLASQLKTLVIRESKSTGEHLVILFVKDQEFPAEKILGLITKLSVPSLRGVQIYYSDKCSPASVPTTLLAEVGTHTLVEHIAGLAIEYSWDAFFQNNLPMFMEAMTRIRQVMPKEKKKLVELYSGAGTIGLALADLAGSVRGIEIIESAAQNANRNAGRNRIGNYHADASAAEKMSSSVLDEADVLLLDPPRAGLHPKVIAMILEKQPETILYLACDPATQARDVGLLREKYTLSSVDGFDFYPRTPHLESLVVLQKSHG